MRVVFNYPYYRDTIDDLKAGDIVELEHLTDTSAIFPEFTMPLNLFFKITEPVKEKAPSKSSRFKPPTLEEVQAYCNERCNSVDPQTFISHYESNGWMRGKNKIKNWKSCIVTWEKSGSKKQFAGKTSGNISACEDFINE